LKLKKPVGILLAYKIIFNPSNSEHSNHIEVQGHIRGKFCLATNQSEPDKCTNGIFKKTFSEQVTCKVVNFDIYSPRVIVRDTMGSGEIVVQEKQVIN
jgi:hypothetical protein